MNDMLFKHVLFKDLRDYVKRTDYFSDYTETEKAWIRKNLNIVGEKELQLLFNENLVTGLNKDKVLELIKKENLKSGFLYVIPYLEKYKLILMAKSSTEFFKNVILITDDPNSPFWDVKSNLDEVVYLKDENGNEASFDFKNIKINGHYTFELNGKDCSNICKGNNLLFAKNCLFTGESNFNFIRGNNNQFKVPVSNLIGEANNLIIKNDEIGLNSDIIKQIIKFDNNYCIDYLDLETLTHQFYVVDTLH